MRLKIILAFLLCSLILGAKTDQNNTDTNSTIQDKVTDTNSTNSTNSTNVTESEKIREPSISLNYMDASLADISWCGLDKETIFILTERGSLYKTANAGESWTKLNDHFIKAGLKEVDTKKEVGYIARMIQSPVNKSMYIFLGTEGLNWITTDCGATIKAINQDRSIREFSFHPTEKNWVLATSWSECENPKKTNCKRYKELLFSDDLGANWKIIAKYVVQFQWAFIDFSFTNFVPKQRIIISHYKNTKGNQQLSGWSEKVQVSMSDDFFQTSKVIVPKGNKFLVTKSFFFVVQVSDETEQDVGLLIGNPKRSVYDLQPIALPNQRIREHSYTILDTSEGQVFLHINHEGPKSTYGNIYISDSTGTRFSLSLSSNVRNSDGQCDFERVQGLEGIYLANVFDKDQLKKIKTLEEEDAIPQEIKAGKKSTGISSKNTLADNTFNKLADYKKTLISFNKGSIWGPLTAPVKDSNDKKIICPDLESCSLHLHSLSNNRFGPFYSTENSLGIILGTGNVGTFLSNRPDEVNTYLSRDGGVTWFEVRKGSHIYEISDHGSLIVMAPDQVSTKEVYYTWNEGLSWEILEISDEPIEIFNIMTEPSNTAEKFVIYGRTKGTKSKGVVIAIDFTPLQQKWCQLPDKPGTLESDYELWTPNGKISPNCLMGHRTTYVRRKREAKCFNSEQWDRWFYFELCECTEEDWECDVGFSRQGNGVCMPDSETKINYDPPEQCNEWYYVTQGYRKVAGDTCHGGINHDYLKLPCPGHNSVSKNHMIILLVLVAIIFGMIIATNNGVLDKFKQLKSKLKGISKKENKKYEGLGGNGGDENEDDFKDLFNDNNLEAAEPVEEKTLIEMGKGKKKMTSGNALEMAKKNVPILNKPGKSGDINLMDFNPRS